MTQADATDLKPNHPGGIANAVGALHHKIVLNRRVEVLAEWFARLLPPRVRVLDVGCGDGLIASAVQSKRTDIRIQGIDVLPRARTYVPVEIFDGSHFPFDDASFDVVMFSDVLHHTDDPLVLLKEARRVASQHVLIKDHNRKGLAAGARLSFMDWTHNARYGVALPYNYWSEAQWQSAWKEVGLQPSTLVTKLGLYPKPADWVFGAKLHFIARLDLQSAYSRRFAGLIRVRPE